MDDDAIFRETGKIGKFTVHTNLCRNIGHIKITPSIRIEVVCSQVIGKLLVHSTARRSAHSSSRPMALCCRLMAPGICRPIAPISCRCWKRRARRCEWFERENRESQMQGVLIVNVSTVLPIPVNLNGCSRNYSYGSKCLLT